MDIKKQIEYWINLSENDLETTGLFLINIIQQNNFLNSIYKDTRNGVYQQV